MLQLINKYKATNVYFKNINELTEQTALQMLLFREAIKSNNGTNKMFGSNQGFVWFEGLN